MGKAYLTLIIGQSNFLKARLDFRVTKNSYLKIKILNDMLIYF